MTSTGLVQLADPEAHHLSHVLRHAVGDSVELFDGRGMIGQAVIARIRKHDVDCDVTEVRHDPPPEAELTLAMAVPKGERFDWLVEKATELGVRRLVPLRTERSTVDPRDSKLDRLRQTIIAACKQSRRTRLMDLTAVKTWSEFLAESVCGSLLIAHPGENASPLDLIGTERQYTFAVGPEGGLTAEEVQAATSRGGRLIGLGPNILRIETAGMALAAWSLFRAKS